MLFNSFGYMLFLVVAVGLHWLLPHRWRIPLLGVASLGFYAMWRWDFALLMIFSAMVDFVAARRIAELEDGKKRRRWLLTSLSINLGLLVFFKYTYFLVDSAASLLSMFGVEAGRSSDLGLSIILPLGISFYTFQTISYTIDVYRRLQEPVSRFGTFLTYVTFWPQLIAGPILRAAEVIPELERERVPSSRDFSAGMLLILVGLAKKVVLADTIAPFVDTAFESDLATLTAIDTWVAATLFGFQIYFDFSGYSDIAIGSARILGISFPDNFNWPYLSTSPREFWKRWHISLSSWIRDYLYTPLTGRVFRSRSKGGISVVADDKGPRLTVALFSTWFLMGLWHGASWTFAIWGVYHAAAVWMFRRFEVLQRVADRSPVIGWGITFPIVMAGWIPFRAQSVADTLSLFGNLIDPAAYLSLGARHLGGASYLLAAALLGGMLVATGMERRLAAADGIPRGMALGGTAVASAVLTILILALQRPVQQFIYFQF